MRTTLKNYIEKQSITAHIKVSLTIGITGYFKVEYYLFWIEYRLAEMISLRVVSYDKVAIAEILRGFREDITVEIVNALHHTGYTLSGILFVRILSTGSVS